MFRWHGRFLQGRESLENDMCTGQPQIVRTERKIQEVASLVSANSSQLVDDLAVAVGQLWYLPQDSD